VRPRIQITAAFLLTAGFCSAARLNPDAQRAFQAYVATVETRLARQHASADTFLAVLNMDPGKRADAQRQLIAGTVRVEPVNGGTIEVSGALLHHWRAAAFVPGATPQEMLALLRDYKHFFAYYAPQVESSRALTDEGESATIAMRVRERKLVSVVLDAIYEVETRRIGNTGGYSFSRSKHIWEIDEPGTPQEHRRAEGEDDGFLWHLNSYWSFLKVRDGLLIKCEAVSLTCDVPVGLNWLITPIIEELPKESLEFTLRATKSTLAARAMKEARR
jgi:hypothetical protein